MSQLENSKIKLRALEIEDIDILYDWENNMNIWNLSNTIVPFSKYILHKYIESSHEDIFTSKQLRLVIQEITSQKPLGFIDLFDFDFLNSRAGIGILINDIENRKKGFAAEALRILIKYCFNTLNLNQLYCNINTDNIDSINLFKKSGFEITGTKKKWNRTSDGFKDEYFLQLLKNQNTTT